MDFSDQPVYYGEYQSGESPFSFSSCNTTPPVDASPANSWSDPSTSIFYQHTQYQNYHPYPAAGVAGPSQSTDYHAIDQSCYQNWSNPSASNYDQHAQYQNYHPDPAAGVAGPSQSTDYHAVDQSSHQSWSNPSASNYDQNAQYQNYYPDPAAGVAVPSQRNDYFSQPPSNYYQDYTPHVPQEDVVDFRVSSVVNQDCSLRVQQQEDNSSSTAPFTFDDLYDWAFTTPLSHEEEHVQRTENIENYQGQVTFETPPPAGPCPQPEESYQYFPSPENAFPVETQNAASRHVPSSLDDPFENADFHLSSAPPVLHQENVGAQYCQYGSGLPPQGYQSNFNPFLNRPPTLETCFRVNGLYIEGNNFRHYPSLVSEASPFVAQTHDAPFFPTLNNGDGAPSRSWKLQWNRPLVPELWNTNSLNREDTSYANPTDFIRSVLPAQEPPAKMWGYRCMWASGKGLCGGTICVGPGHTIWRHFKKVHKLRAKNQKRKKKAAEGPVEGSVEGSVEGPAEGPVEGPAEAPVEGPAEAPVEGLAKNPVERPAKKQVTCHWRSSSGKVCSRKMGNTALQRHIEESHLKMKARCPQCHRVSARKGHCQSTSCLDADGKATIKCVSLPGRNAFLVDAPVEPPKRSKKKGSKAKNSSKKKKTERA